MGLDHGRQVDACPRDRASFLPCGTPRGSRTPRVGLHTSASLCRQVAHFVGSDSRAIRLEL